jgi:hypothetical protein
VFDPGQPLLDNEGARLGGKKLQRRAITQRGLGLAQPNCGIRGLSSEDLLGAGRAAALMRVNPCSSKISLILLTS